MAVRSVSQNQVDGVELDATENAPTPARPDHSGSGESDPESAADVEIDNGADESDARVLSERSRRAARLALIVVLVTLATLFALVGWLGFQTYEVVNDQHQRAQFLAAGRDGATRLTTISPENAEAEVKKILDSSTGPFHEDFQKRSPSFIEMVERMQSKTEGTVIEAGLESVNGNQADVLLAISVKTSLAGAEAPARLWRMRISVQRVGTTEKVSNVQYVP